ncbi:MAG: MotA/TolQ/ExbB proton channel family protein [bacterium]
MESYTFVNLMKVSIIMPVIFALSVIMVGFAIERIWCFVVKGGISERFLQKIKRGIQKSDVESIRAACQGTRGILAETMGFILEAAVQSEHRAEKVMRIKRQQVRAVLGRRLAVFGTLSYIAPLLGLLGTVMGVMRAFHDLSVSGAGGPNIVAAGVSEALITTIAGIAVAVVASVLNNYFIARIKNMTNHIDITGRELMMAVSKD